MAHIIARHMANVLQPMQFNDLTSLWRQEKGTSALTVVRRDLYSAMQDLYERQCQECERMALEDRDSLLFDGASEKKRRIYTTMRDITFERMAKITSLAIRGVMGANNVLDVLTPEEKDYYEKIHEASRGLLQLTERKKRTVTMDIVNPGKVMEPEKEEMVITGTVVENVLSEGSDVPEMEIPEPVSEPPVIPPMEEIDEFPEDTEDAEIPEDVPDVIPQPVEEDVVRPEPEEKVEAPKDPDGMLVVRITEDLQPFSSLGDTVYRLKKEDIMRLPAIFAFALMNRGVAVAVDITT